MIDDEGTVHEDVVVSLNVGGQHFDTSSTTLLKEEPSFFHALLSSKLQTRKVDGRIFIDRDGKTFRHVLNYLRDGPEIVSSLDSQTLKELRREANFYQLTLLLNAIDKELEESKKYAVVYLGGYGANSKVYTEDTQGGFSTSCATLNELAKDGFVVEGVLSGSPGQYYAIARQVTKH